MSSVKPDVVSDVVTCEAAKNVFINFLS